MPAVYLSFERYLCSSTLMSQLCYQLQFARNSSAISQPVRRCIHESSTPHKPCSALLCLKAATHNQQILSCICALSNALQHVFCRFNEQFAKMLTTHLLLQPRHHSICQPIASLGEPLLRPLLPLRRHADNFPADDMQP